MKDILETIKYTQNLKLLYVEDNDDARQITIVILEELFDNIVIAKNGQDGLDKFKDNDIDLIITDINMPKLNGLEMIKKIREIDKDIPILVLSAYNESGYFLDSIKMGVEGYLLKPIDMDQFAGVLAKVVQKIKLKDEVEKNVHFLKEYEEATNTSSIVSKTDSRGIITYANSNFCKISGYSKEELIGKNHNIIRHEDMDSKAFFDMWDTIKNKKQIWTGTVKNKTKNGKSYYVQSTVKPVLDQNSNIIEYIALRNDITNVMHPKQQLNDAIKSMHEPLIVYMKIEDFDALEELYDNLIVDNMQDIIRLHLEKRLSSKYKFEKIYPLENGEYAFVNEKSICMQNEDSFTKELKIYQENIRDSIVNVGDIEYGLSIIISYAYGTNQVLENAKLGIRKLLKTKQDFIASNNFSQLEYNKAQENIKKISMIKKAINNCKIISYFQPIINNKTKQIDKYESLVRLIDEDGNILSPFFFLDTAKKGKYYSQITRIVLSNSFAALKDTDKDISINLSVIDIEQKETRENIFKLLEEYQEYRDRIILELLEDENVKDFRTIMKFIDNVKKLDVKIAIDDFGAGYSNFERLVNYRPDILKIDGCLVRDIETDSYSLSVVKTIVAFAKEQKIQIVAEYVENEAIFNILNGLGIEYSQGYYFGKPEALILEEFNV